MRSQTQQHLPGIDALKAIASQLIVLHHLAYYGPMADVSWNLAPDLFAWLANHARVAVQVFLVVAGFLAAHALAPDGTSRIEQPLSMLAKRYLRLVLPFGAALLITMLCAAWAREQLLHDMIPAASQAGQFAAHILLLHGVLGVESLSTGVWYVAIDLQLFALLLGCLWLGQRIDARCGGKYAAGPLLVVTLGVLALFYFNRDADFDKWGLYFFGAYMLGVSARWALASKALRERFFALIMLCGLALVMDYRVRVLVALLVACWLWLSISRPSLAHWLEARPIKWLGRISYAVFLIHFSVLLIVNTAFINLFPESVTANAIGVVVAWALSIVAGDCFHRRVEVPALGWAKHIAGLRPLAWLGR